MNATATSTAQALEEGALASEARHGAALMRDRAVRRQSLSDYDVQALAKTARSLARGELEQRGWHGTLRDRAYPPRVRESITSWPIIQAASWVQGDRALVGMAVALLTQVGPEVADAVAPELRQLRRTLEHIDAGEL